MKIAIIIPYFGVLPNYFDLWLLTAAQNRDIDFFVITDIDINSKFINANNINIVRMSFLEVKERIQKLVDFKIELNSPYKLCDYKPTYGLAFSDIVKEYDYWGHCDSDIIWGNLRKFITDEILEKYEKIYSRGHLTLYKNNLKMNNFFKINHKYKKAYTYKEAFTTAHSCGYDEWGDSKFGMGLSWIAEKEGIGTYDNIDFADIKVNVFNLEFDQYKKKQAIFRWNNGKLVAFYKSDEDICCTEVAYLHLQKRKMQCSIKKIEDGFIIVPNKFIDNISNITNKEFIYFDKSKLIYFEWYKTRCKGIFKRLRNGAIKQIIYRRRAIKNTLSLK